MEQPYVYHRLPLQDNKKMLKLVGLMIYNEFIKQVEMDSKNINPMLVSFNSCTVCSNFFNHLVEN
jgi:hypothetical protein